MDQITARIPEPKRHEMSVDQAHSIDYAAAQRDYWKGVHEKLIADAVAQAGGAEELTVNGVPWFTHKPTETFRKKDFATAYPEMADYFTRQRTEDFFDTEALRRTHPEIYREFRSHSFRATKR